MSTKEVKSEITGTVWKILLEPGAAVEEESEIMVLESMKMEIPVLSPIKGTVSEILVQGGDTVNEGQVIVRISA